MDRVRSRLGRTEPGCNRRKILTGFCMAVIILLVLTACSEPPPPPSVLRIGLTPDRDAIALRAAYQPLLEHISQEIDTPIEIVIPDSYQHLLDLFLSKKIDIARLGGYGYVKAHTANKAVPLVMRDVDRYFSSIFLIHADHPATSLQQLKGATFSFGSPLSTSGHLMPRFFLREKNLNPEELFSHIEYSRTHDESALKVQEKKVDAAVANSNIIRVMFKNGQLKQSRVRILWETPEYPDYVWAVQADLDPELQNKIRDTLLSLSPNNAKHNLILKNINAKYFLPAKDTDFDMLRSIISHLRNGIPEHEE